MAATTPATSSSWVRMCRRSSIGKRPILVTPPQMSPIASPDWIYG